MFLLPCSNLFSVNNMHLIFLNSFESIFYAKAEVLNHLNHFVAILPSACNRLKGFQIEILHYQYK